MSAESEGDSRGGDITSLLAAWRGGDEAAESALWEAIHPVMRRLAARQAAGSAGLELQPTELVHEAFLRLQEQSRVDWASRGHFLAIAARVLRRALVDHLRARGREKRGGDVDRIPVEDVDPAAPGSGERTDWLDLHEALSELEARDPRCARVVELRYFGGMTLEEVAEVCGISVPTAVRDWRFARGWLRTRLSDRG